MNEENIFKQINLVRQNTLNEMQELSEEEADQMPEGFRNTIRWNLGHIYTVQNALLSKFGGKEVDMPSPYLELFAPGTKPADWKGDIPTLGAMKEKLENQPEQLKKALAGQLDEEAVESFKSLSTVGEILTFTMYHEGMHVGAIQSIKKANSAAK